MARRLSITRTASVLLALALAPRASVAKSLIDYFKPIPVVGSLNANAWGAANVRPRDQDNGLEDKALRQWVYWDGKILKGVDGKYHLLASRWDQSQGHNGWFGSVAVHAVSESSPLGPFIDKGLAYNDQNGKGHNVTAAQLQDGRYCLLVSETRRPAAIYTATSLDGPWRLEGTITTDANGYNVDASPGGELHSNTAMVVRPDGSILMTSRHGVIMLSTTGILGPYKVQGTSVYPSMAGYNNANAEDPVIWYSGGQYHITVNWWDARKAFHLTSRDGIRNWQNAGLAYDPNVSFIRYTDGTTNKWYKIERPGVLIENGHVSHFTFAVIDVEKDQDVGNDTHGSKVIVVPFDGELFDAETGVDGGGGQGGGAGRGGGGGGGGGGAGGRGGTPANGGAGGLGRGGAGGGSGGIGGRGGADGGADAGATDAGSGGAGADAGSGGRASTGGRDGSGSGGASSGSGGATGGAGGVPATGGRAAGSGGSGSGGALGGGSANGSSGCSCALASGARAPDGGGIAVIASLAAVMALRRRRRAR